MIRERIADDIYVFTSDLYAQVTAGAVLTQDGVILIDTLYHPQETLEIKEFLEGRLGHTIRYVINTHYHADHTQGSYLFPHAQIVSHAKCRALLDSSGRSGLKEAQSHNPKLNDVRIALPNMVFDGDEMSIQLGGKILRLLFMPGHSLDLIGVYVTNNRVLFASDNMMPVPTLFDGDHAALVNSLKMILELKPDSVIQGHGEAVLRGKISSVIESNLSYLEKIKQEVEQVVARGETAVSLENISIESCGKSQVPLNGLVVELHQANLYKLYGSIRNKPPGGLN